MVNKNEEMHPEVAQLVTGHFHETAGYETWRARGTSDWLLIATVDGGGRFGHAGGEFTTIPGDLVLCRPGTRHDYGVAPDGGGWELLWAHFHPRPDWSPWLVWPEEAPGLMRLTLPDPVLWRKVLGRFTEAHHLATGALRQRETFAMNALEALLLWCDTQNPLSEQAGLDSRVRDAMDLSVRASGRTRRHGRSGPGLRPVAFPIGASISAAGRPDPAAIPGRPAPEPGAAAFGIDASLHQRHCHRSRL